VDGTADSEARAGLASVTRGTALILVATLIFVGLGFATRVLLVRAISLGEWNAFSLGLSVSGVLAAIGTLGLPNAVARSVAYADSDAERRSILRTTFLVGTTSAVVAAAALFALAGPIGRALAMPDVTLALEFFPVAVACNVIQSLIASVFQGFEDTYPTAAFVLVLNPALFLAFLTGLGVSAWGIGFETALIAYAVANVVTLVALVVHALRKVPQRLSPGPGAPGARGRLLRLAAPLFLVGAMASLIGTGDTLVLGAFHANEVGTYSASLTLARLIQIGVSAAGYIFLPVAAGYLRRGDRASLALTYGTVTKWMVIVALPLVLLFAVMPEHSLGFVYGSGYTSVVLPLQLASVAAFATALLGPAAPAQIAFGDARLQAYNGVVAAGVDLGVALALVPPYGYVGAAVAWGTANITWSALCLGEVALLRGVHPFRRAFVVPLVVTLVPTAAALFLLRAWITYWMLPPLALALAGGFVAVVLLTGSIDSGDRLLLEAIEQLLGRPLPFLRRLGRFAHRGLAPP